MGMEVGKCMVSPYMGIFPEVLHLYGLVFRKFTTMRAYTHHESL